MVDESIIEIVRRYLRLLNERGVPASFAVLFGSFARGDQRPESDVDVIIVSKEYDEDWRKWNRKLWELRYLVDARIEPTPVGEHEFETDDTSIRIEMARREGIRISPS
ncbi:MAG: nucleotidyltransferase domain-containing protein [Candidatus Coatesbacteria bacterium]|nr:nucleotidyltransferase domain-containing protein [Candidatus Coatesbacteria bacterium]